MKLLCIGRNYGAHALELGNAIPEEPVLFLKPASALVHTGTNIRIPAWTRDLHHEIELVYRIARRCTNVAEADAMTYVDGVTVGIDLTARDLQSELKKKGLPWEKAKAFDGSAVIGAFFVPVPTDPTALEFSLHRNGAIVQAGSASDMIFNPAALVAHVSRYITMEAGDLLFTGTPSGVGPVEPGDRLEGFLNGDRLFDLRVEG